MPFTDADARDFIAKTIGDVNPSTGDPVPVPDTDRTGVIAQNIEALWEKYAEYETTRVGLRELYVRRDCVRLVLAVLATRVYDAADNIDGLSMRANHIWEHYQQMLTESEKELRTVLTSVSKESAAVIDRITAKLCRGYPLTTEELLQYPTFYTTP